MIVVIMRPIVADFTCVFNNYNYTLSYSNNVILVLQIHNSNLIQNTSVNLIACWHILVEVIIFRESDSSLLLSNSSDEECKKGYCI